MEVGRKIGEWTVESGPYNTKGEAEDSGRAIVDGTKWTVTKASNGKWWVLIK